jgi:glycosyltransferase involved in cell wall biosynthesis
MRVLHIYSGNLFGGIEALLVTLARHRDLCPEMEPHFALCFEGRLSEELTAAGAAVHFLGEVRIRHVRAIWKARRKLSQLLESAHYDAIVTHGCWPHALFAPIVRLHGLPLVFWMHGAPQGRHWLERWARSTKPDLVLANSHFIQSTVPRLFDDVCSEVVYYPVPDDHPVHLSRVRKETRTALNTPDDAVVIIQASRLERWKGHLLLLESLEQLRDISGWVCWIAGGPQRPQESKYLDEVKASAKSRRIADRTRFLGQRCDVPQLVAAADIHCQPNILPEPFGIAFVEALYAGLPVVTTRMGGPQEIVDHSCGMLTSADAESVSGALRDLIMDSRHRKRLRANGPARARAICDPQRQIASIAELFKCVPRPSRYAKT